MPSKRLNKIISELSFGHKLVAFGSLFMIISTFMPWYQDLDSFRTGEMFLGITGPLYLAGFSLIIFSVLNVFLLYAKASGIKTPFDRINNNLFYLFVGISSFYLLILVNSVYFHPKFGVNITIKQSQFGIFLAFVSAGLIIAGSYFCLKNKHKPSNNLFDSEENSLLDSLSENINYDHKKRSDISFNQPDSIKENLNTEKIDKAEKVEQENPQLYRMDL